MDLKTFSLQEIRKEIRRELEMRRKVWQTVSGMPEQFISMEHQRKYDILRQLSIVLEFGKEIHFESLQKSATNYQFKEAENNNSPDLFTT